MLKRGVITFVFDDGYEKVFRNALPLLNKYGLKGVFAVPLDTPHLAKNLRQRQLRPWPKWLPLREQGHEIASHCVTHPNLTTVSEQQLRQELKKPASLLKAATIVYPGGAFDNRVVKAARQYYRAGRTVVRGYEAAPPRDPMRLKVMANYSRRNFSVLKANARAVRACLTNSWVIETYHMIDEDDRQMVHAVKTEDFARHLKFVSKLPVAVKTISQIVCRSPQS